MKSLRGLKIVAFVGAVVAISAAGPADAKTYRCKVTGWADGCTHACWFTLNVKGPSIVTARDHALRKCQRQGTHCQIDACGGP